MNIKLLLESGLFERTRIRSGRIYREGIAPEYGVIFTSNETRSEDDLGLNPHHMLGALIGPKEAAESNRDDFFEILGGYFYHDNYPEPPKTTRVFGIALTPEFGMTEGGSTTFNDNWKLDDPEKPFLDESHWSKPDRKFHGWTFIVEPKERDRFPKSHDEFKIFAVCAEIKDISVVIGECENDPRDNQLKRKVTFQSSTGEIQPQKWTWVFGDGDSKSGTGRPPESIRHFYENKPNSEPKLCLEGHPACDENYKTINLSEFDTFKKCQQCPEIKDIKVTIGECETEGEIRRRLVTFAASIDGDEPDSWIWHFGDGTTESGTGNLPDVTNHYYEKKPANFPQLCINGPEPCNESCKEVDLSEFEECPPCPKIKHVEHIVSDKDDISKSVKFIVVTKDGVPDEFKWNWGNGSTEETSNDATASHDFKMPAKGIAKYAIDVTSKGPGDCQDCYKKTIDIPAPDVPVKPEYCFLFPLIVAFLMAVTLGTFIVYSVANTFEQALDYDWLAPIIVVLSVLTLIAIIIWYQYSRKIPCPTPSKCDWLGIGWVVMLAGMLVAFYVKDCCAAWWWVIIIFLLGLAALPFYFWYKKCEVTVKTIVFHLIACLLAAACVCYLIANNLFAHCLR